MRRLMFIVLPTLLVLLAAGAGFIFVSHRHYQADLLAGTWSYMPGVTVNADRTLQVDRTGLAILSFADNDHPDAANSKYLSNPPVNLFGTHLETKGIFDISGKVSQVDGSATVSLYSAPPVRYDERIVRQPGLDVSIDDKNLTVYSWTTPGGAAETKSVPLAKAGNYTLDISQSAGEITVTVNSAAVTIPAAPLNNQVWFGLDTADSFKLNTLTVTSTGNRLQAIDTSKPDYGKSSSKGLAALAATHGHKQQLGTAVDLTAMMGDPNYTKFIVQNFNEVETEMMAKFQAIHPQPDNYQFGELDALVAFANKHNLTVHGHALIFGEAYPKWLSDQLTSGDRDQAIKLLQDHITTVVSRYDGKHGHGTIAAWDVVNEPLSADNPTQLSTYNLWYKALGPDYIPLAFNAARTANPNALLGINENGMEADPARGAALFKFVKQTNATSNIIDFVGYQAHFDEDTLDDDDAMKVFNNGELAKQFKAYAAIGVKVRISEATVALNDNADAQAKVYGRLLTTCLQAANCTGFNLWGATNSTAGYFYNTGNILEKDPGDDAPTTQDGQGKVKLRSAWGALLKDVKT